jgi:glycosyltransferase involved in cell wall biosynthesis
MPVTKRLLMIAYHFPPLAGSSGIQRTLRFVQHLPKFGWQAAVLTASPMAYERTSDDLLAEIPPGTVVRRAFALDSARHLAVKGRHLGWSALPDRWRTWRLGARFAAGAMLREWRPNAIWSTYPIATAHQIGADLQRRSGLPWIADFRDPMAQPGYPADPATWRCFVHIERRAIERARFAVFTTPGAARVYRERYPDAAARVRLIENGYDEESFASSRGAVAPTVGPVVLLHSGIVYPSERDPRALIEALGRVRRDAGIGPDRLRLRFRAAVHDALLQGLAREHGVADQVEVEPPLGYRAALDEMQRAHGLLVLQATNCNDQIPAKLYEYLRAGRPIVGLTDPAGDTAGVLRRSGVDRLAPLDDVAAIATMLERTVHELSEGDLRLPAPAAVHAASRAERARELALLLDEAVAGGH